MKVIGHKEFGGPEVLREFELDDPVPGPGEVLIRVRAVAVSPTDTLRRAGIRREEMQGQEMPYVPGMELSGTIEGIGEGTTTTLSLGDPVIGVLFPKGTQGSYSEKIVLPVESVTRMPEGADYFEAATLPMNGLTARMTLDELDLSPGQTIAVTGAAGTYGGYVIQLAKAAGLHVIADAADNDWELVASLGADDIVARGDDVVERIRELKPDGVDGLADGAVLNQKVLPAVKKGGRLVTVRHFESDPVNDVTIHPIRVRHYVREWDKLDELRAMAETGALSLRVAQIYPAKDAQAAHQRLAEGGVRGRLILDFGGEVK